MQRPSQHPGPGRTGSPLRSVPLRPGAAADPSSTQTLAPFDVLRIGWDRRWLLAATAIATALAAVALGLLQRPKFEACATVLLDASARGGLFGNLNMLSPIAGGAAATAEISVLRSRSVVNSVVREDETGARTHHLGLTTHVADESHTVPSILGSELSGDGAGRPAAQPPCRLFASLLQLGPEAPSTLGVEFLTESRVRLSAPGLLSRLGLKSDEPAEFDFAPGTPLVYSAVELLLEPTGSYAGRSFSISKVPAHEASDGLLERFWAAETVRNSGVIRITVEDGDPFRAAETANAIIENYLDLQRARRERRSVHTIEYIESMLDDSRVAMEEAQAQLTRIRTQRPELIDLSATSGVLVAELAGLESRITGLSLRERALQEVLDQLAQGDALALARLDSAVSGGLFVDPITEGYLERIASLNARYIELSQDFQDQHPRLVDLRGTIAETMDLIARQIASRVEGIRFQREALEAQHEQELAELTELPSEMQNVARTMVEYQTHKELVPELLKNLKATEIAESSTDFVAQFLDHAEPATRLASPNIQALGAVGGVLGLLLGLLVLVVRDPITGRVRGRRDLESALARPTLGMVPLLTDRRADEHDSRTLDAVRSLRAAVKNLDSELRSVRVLGLTTVTGNARGPRLSTALARAFAREGTSVSLIESDLHGRPLTKLFQLDELPGLADALSSPPGSPQRLRDASGFALLPAGTNAATASDLLGGGMLDELLARLTLDSDYVLVDLPACDSPDVEAMAPKLDGLLIACEQGRSRRLELRAACERVERAGGTVLGTVLLTRRGNGDRA